MKCKVTNNQLDPFMSFGKMPIANGFIEEKTFPKNFLIWRLVSIKICPYFN